MYLPVDIFLVVELIDDVLQRAACLFWYVLHVLDLVLERLAVRFGPWGATRRQTGTTPRLRRFILSPFYLLLRNLVIKICVESELFEAVSGCLEGLPAAIEDFALVDFEVSISHTLLRIGRIWLVFEMTSIQFGNDISFIVFELSPQVFHSFILVWTPIVFLEVASKTCCDQQAWYLLVLGWIHSDGLEDLFRHFVFEVGYVMD